MTAEEQDRAALARCCCGNEEAMGFLTLWRRYVHEIDDIIDGDRTDPESILGTFALAISVYSHPFYLRNIGGLRQLVVNVTNDYADSVAWEKSQVDWQRTWADHYRHCGSAVVLAVAYLCGGYEHMRSISQELRHFCYWEHHTKEGKAV